MTERKGDHRHSNGIVAKCVDEDMNVGAVTGREPETVLVDPASLSAGQRAGQACAVCDKRWPRPTVKLGELPDGSPVMACVDCA